MRLGLWLVVLLALWSCRSGVGAERKQVRARGALVDARARVYPGAVSSELAQAIVGPDGRYFEVQLRTSEIQNFPCTSCHGGNARSEETRSSHHDLDPIHPRAAAGNCETCHLRQDPAILSLLTGERVTLDHAYRLCAQCHFSQVAAWAGGGHGKRVATWAGRRVVLNCTGCHNPHKPAFPKRLPRPGPGILRRVE
jgi:hypothetical protein